MAAKSSGNGVRRTKKAASTKPPVTAGSLSATSISLQEEIRRRAYEIYLERGGVPGSESEDWLVAEREVLARSATAGHSA